ncbi:MAG: NAD-dependent epimerase/dehydratase family protein [Candidatus Diapherotrites archaeon]|uniref:NAD-dependent epimerase/dehydratase family protein n=1 Tax=Candidatus Iainarchaeum sp. TaxID=3101447 RepID=A0A8T3YK84_9ARCH|nr:NAD-dependent epimerase/dehydratase family protein [Candidatus Diapherotrites archaeon]
MMRVAVTGSEGFLGKIVCKKLVERGHKVTACTMENCNVLDKAKLGKAFSNAEAVVHLAAILDEEAQDLYEVNVKGTENALEACAANSVQQFILVSTAGVYGSLPGMKGEETPPAPETQYERSKLDAERKALSYQEVFHVTILRLALVLGPNEYWRQIAETVQKGFPLIGSGSNRWQLVAAEDAAEAIAFCIGKEECYGETFIAAEKDALTLEETVNLIRASLGMKGNTMKVPLWLGNIIVALNSVLKFNKLLKPEYVKRLQADRIYSTRKLEAAGWKAGLSTRNYLPEVVKEMTANEKAGEEKQ